MADAKQRKLERLAAGGDAAAQSKLLVARLRRQDLAEDRLWLAGYLRDPGALDAVQRTFDVKLPQKTFRPWIRGLGKHINGKLPLPWEEDCKEICARVAIVLALHGKPLWKKEGGKVQRLTKTIRLVRAWLKKQTREKADAVLSANLGSSMSPAVLVGQDFATLLFASNSLRAAKACGAIGDRVLAAEKRAGRKKPDLFLEAVVRDAMLEWVLA